MITAGTPTRTAFRPEVQALRAIAVMGVVIYHLWPSALPGGFVGVDVFFVISGFLITSQLVTEAHEPSRISLTRFYARRIRRIIPAAVTVLVACVVIVRTVMPPLAWQTNLADIKAAAAYFENWQLGAHAVNYLAASNSPTIVQHYWSLSVEEQFYLAWPLLVLLTAGVVKSVRRDRLDRALAALLAVLAAASFVTSWLWTARQPAMAFFATPTRAWEFAGGGLVAIALRQQRRVPEWARIAVSWTGVAVVAGSMVLITRHDAFPGWIAALPVLGAALVVSAELSPRGARSPERWMRNRQMQWLGNNSYSIYLWHWPLIIAAPWVLHGPLQWPAKLAILAMSLVLAGMSTLVIEDPIRRGRLLRARRWPAYGLAATGVAAVVLVSSTISVDLGRAERHVQLAAQRASSVTVRAPHRHSCFGAAAMVPSNHCRRPYARPKNLDTAFAENDGRNDPCLQSAYAPSTPLYCTFGHLRHPRQVIGVIGNSHAWRLVPALKLYAQRHDWEVIEAARINCLGLITTATGPNGATPACLSWGAQVEQHLLSLPRLTGVVFASYRYWQEFTSGPHPTYGEVAATSGQIVAMWRRFHAAGVRVFVVQDVPGMRPTLDPQCIAASSVRYDPCAVPARSVIRSSLTTRLAQENPALATYVPIDQYFCAGGRCHALIGGVVVYFDDHHMTSTFSRSMAEYLGQSIDTAFGTLRRPRPVR